MEVTIIKACCDLGTHVDGANLGPDRFVENYYITQDIKEVRQPDIKKSHDEEDKHKNEEAINQFNQELYEKVTKTLEENHFPVTVGGDHSIAIASTLAAIKHYQNLGIIWFDSHADYNTFETTITGNIHGLPLAAINGLNKELSMFHNGPYYDPHHTVIVGYRAKEENQEAELNVIKQMGVTVFTTDDIKQEGIQIIVQKAMAIATQNTNGVHISYDLDVIDPIVAPGVSIKEPNGLTKQESLQFVECLKPYQEKITSLDIVEFNPLNDQNDQTLKIAREVCDQFLTIKKELVH